MLHPNNFHKPTHHPFGMLAGIGLVHTSENESFLVWMLIQCQEQGGWVAIQTDHSHPSLVKTELLTEVGERQYKLSRKAKGLLYAYYGKDEN